MEKDAETMLEMHRQIGSLQQTINNLRQNTDSKDARIAELEQQSAALSREVERAKEYNTARGITAVWEDNVACRKQLDELQHDVQRHIQALADAEAIVDERANEVIELRKERDELKKRIAKGHSESAYDEGFLDCIHYAKQIAGEYNPTYVEELEKMAQRFRRGNFPAQEGEGR